MLKTIQVSAVALAFAAAFGTAQAGDINDDINACRDAIDEAELMGDTAFTLKLLDDEGNRNRVVTLEAVVVGGEDKVIECRMNRSKVKEVVFADA